jgi:hypothetical protein
MIPFFHLPGSNEIVARPLEARGCLPIAGKTPASEDAATTTTREVWHLNVAELWP